VSQRSVADWTVADYERAAQEYCASLPLEHFMEATPQSTQRKITLESLDLVTVQRPEVQVFNELLVQYPVNDHIGQVVPDNMVVCSDEPVTAAGSFNLRFEAATPFLVLEYVSRLSKRKDYVDNLRRYEQELKVPYYLIFDPDRQDLRLYRHTGAGYQAVDPDARGRRAIPELELEVGLLDGWVRFWFRGELLPLPAELQRQVDELQAEIDRAERRTRQAERRAETHKRRAETEKRRAAQKRQQREAAESEVARLRALVEQMQPKKPGGRTRKKP
jgi:Uma2 family endonuclease